MSQVQQAVILAGGTGSRLKSINGSIPKILAEVNGMSILELQLRNMISEGITIFLYLLGVNSDFIVPKLKGLQKEYEAQVSIKWIIEDEKLGTGGSLLNALDSLKEAFIVIYGDLYVNLNLSDLSKTFLESKSDFACVAHPSRHMTDSNLIVTDSKNRIIDYCGKGNGQDNIYRNLANSGIYFFRKYLLTSRVVTRCDLDADIIPDLLHEGKFGIILRHHGIVKDIGTPKRLMEMQNTDFPSQFYLLKRPTLFLDRDGVINRHVGHVEDFTQIEIMPGIGKLISRFNDEKYWVLVVTNQPIIAHGKLSDRKLRQIHGKIDQELSISDAYVDEYFVCPHHPDKGFQGEIASLKVRCQCRKPKIGLFNDAKETYKIDLGRSLMIGDTWRDEEFAKNVGVSFVSLATLKKDDIDFSHVVDQVFPIKNWWRV